MEISKCLNLRIWLDIRLNIFCGYIHPQVWYHVINTEQIKRKVNKQQEKVSCTTHGLTLQKYQSKGTLFWLNSTVKVCISKIPYLDPRNNNKWYNKTKTCYLLIVFNLVQIQNITKGRFGNIYHLLRRKHWHGCTRKIWLSKYSLRCTFYPLAGVKYGSKVPYTFN